MPEPKPSIDEIHTQYIHDDTLRRGAEMLFNIANEHKMRNRWMSYNSFTFTYRGVNVFNITMRATMSNKGVRNIDPTNHFIVQLSLGRMQEVERILLAHPEEMRREYLDNRGISCGVCAGTPDGRIIRGLDCDKTLIFIEGGKTHYLCTLNMGYACHNPTPEQFDVIEQFIFARIAAIDAMKSK
ncbi:MAG: hypothetical protein FWC73_09225 [Defluviitaleaceae bacterium]|nr:hypothetical protein [Defluviitaleaceae bacterium]